MRKDRTRVSMCNRSLQDECELLPPSPRASTLIQRYTRILCTATAVQLTIFSYQHPPQYRSEKAYKKHESSAYTHTLDVIRTIIIRKDARTNQRTHLANDVQNSHAGAFLTVTLLIVECPCDDYGNSAEETCSGGVERDIAYNSVVGLQVPGDCDCTVPKSREERVEHNECRARL